MSRLFTPEDLPPAPSRYASARPVTRSNRRGGPLHPEEIAKRLAEKSEEEMPKTGWHWPFGWLLVLWCPDGTKRYVDIPSSKDYAAAAKIRDDVMESDDYDGCSLIQKTYEKK